MGETTLMVGREGELARATELLRRSGPVPFVVVEGEAGIGKTRFLVELADGARRAGHAVVVGSAERPDVPDPEAFGLWNAVLRDLGLRLPPVDPMLPADERRWEVLELVEGALDPDGTLLVLDDLHWADDASLWVLERLVGPRARVPVVASSRPPPDVAAPRWPAVRRSAEVVVLDVLDVGDVARLVSLLGGDPADAGEIHARTAGNPLFVREVVTGAAATGSSAVSGSAVVSDHVEQLLARIGPSAAETVRLMALAGATTPTSVLALARGVEPAEVLDGVEEARRLDLLRAADDGRVAFRHALLAETLVARMSSRRRASLHSALAAAWSGAGSDQASRLRACGHLLAACPDVDVDDVMSQVLDLAAELSVTGRAAESADLLETAAAVADAYRPGDVRLRARLRLGEGEARWVTDEIERAQAVCEEAAALASETDDIQLRVAAEVASLGHHNPFTPDPGALARLEHLDELLDGAGAGVDSPLRVRLLGRRAILSVSFPDRLEEAHTLGDAAIEMARRLGDPELVVTALRDRFFGPVTVEDLEAKGRAGGEILTLARAAHRIDLGLVGHEWVFADHLARGDLARAVDALDDFEAHARIMSSPAWRYSALLRRVGVLAIAGRFDDAMAMSDAAHDVGCGVFPDLEVLGLRIATVLTTLGLFGLDDPSFRGLHERMVATAGEWPVGFIQIRLAVGDLHLGDREAAARRITPWGHRPEVLLHGPEGLTTLALLAELVLALGQAEHAPALRRCLLPYAGRLPVVNALGANLPIDDSLSGLALLVDDLPGAIEMAISALATARAMPSPPFEARCLARLAQAQLRAGDRPAAASARDAAEVVAERIGLVLDPPGRDPGPPGRTPSSTGPAPSAGVAATPRRAELARLDGEWTISSPGGHGTVTDSVGMAQLARLLATPGREIAAVDLAGFSEEVRPPDHDLGPALDARAKREYRNRISELEVDIDEADRHHDLERAAQGRAELDLLMSELRRAVGLSGRDRPQGSGAERARVNVTRNLRRAIAAVSAAVPDLGAHLAVSVRTGQRCVYAPEPAAALDWSISS